MILRDIQIAILQENRCGNLYDFCTFRWIVMVFFLSYCIFTYHCVYREKSSRAVCQNQTPYYSANKPAPNSSRLTYFRFLWDRRWIYFRRCNVAQNFITNCTITTDFLKTVRLFAPKINWVMTRCAGTIVSLIEQARPFLPPPKWPILCRVGR